MENFSTQILRNLSSRLVFTKFSPAGDDDDDMMIMALWFCESRNGVCVYAF